MGGLGGSRSTTVWKEWDKSVLYVFHALLEQLVLFHQSLYCRLSFQFGKLQDCLRGLFDKVQDPLFSDSEKKAVLFVVSHLRHIPGLDFGQKGKILFVTGGVLAEGGFCDFQSLCPSVDLGLEVNGWDNNPLRSFSRIFPFLLEYSDRLILLLLNDIIQIAKVAIESNEPGPPQVLVPAALVDIFFEPVLFDLRFL